MTALVKQHLARAKDWMKRQADKNHSEPAFHVGDWVFLKAQPYLQSSLAPRANQKLSFKFFGPYQIMARVGSIAYKLQLLDTSAVHPVFHVSQLKRLVGDHHAVTPSIPDDSFQWSIAEKILQHRVIARGLHQVVQGLIQWSQVPSSLSTWEDLEALQQ